jgi:hypothetical protein
MRLALSFARDWIASAHQRGTGVSTVYHYAEDDLLTNIRAAMSR